jgi:flagellar assembly protein FliH
LTEAALGELERGAFAKGYAQGERAGAEAASATADALWRRLTQAIDEVAAQKRDVIGRAERHVVQLAMAIANRILHREVSVDRALLLALARVALDRLDEHTAATVRLHPDDYALIMAAPERRLMSEHVQVVGDPAVERGGCVVHTDFGLMNVGLDGQFSELARTLLGESDLAPSGDPRQELHGVAVG